MIDSLESKSKELLKGTIVYFIGNILTQLLGIVLLKYITGSVTTEEYGYFSLIVTIDNLVTPMITLQISDAAFRFLIKSDTKEQKKIVFSTCTLIIGIGALLSCVLVFGLNCFIRVQCPVYIALYIISTNIFAYMQRVARSLGKNEIFIVANLCKALIYGLCIVMFVINSSNGVKGLLISNCISTYTCILFLIVVLKLHKLFCFQRISYELSKKMIAFSAPLIPNTAVWWMQSSINSLIITAQIGASYNGIYSVSNKFAAILHLVINVFDLAWQESAIREYDSEGYKEFVTDIFDKYVVFLLSSIAVFIPFLKLIVPVLIDVVYLEAVTYIPFLLLATALSACSGFFAQLITAKNQNIKLLYTNIIGAVTNILIVFSLIGRIGIWAIIVSVLVSNLILVISRFSVVKELILRIDVKKYLLLVFFNLICCSAFLYGNTYILMLTLIAGVGVFFVSNYKIINKILKMVVRRI